MGRRFRAQLDLSIGARAFWLTRLADYLHASLRTPGIAELSAKIEQALTLQLNAMTETEVEATLAILNGTSAKGTDGQ